MRLFTVLLLLFGRVLRILFFEALYFAGFGKKCSLIPIRAFVLPVLVYMDLTAGHTLPDDKSLDTSFCFVTGNHDAYAFMYFPATRAEARAGATRLLRTVIYSTNRK
jgi:hypothetical protein